MAVISEHLNNINIINKFIITHSILFKGIAYE